MEKNDKDIKVYSLVVGNLEADRYLLTLISEKHDKDCRGIWHMVYWLRAELCFPCLVLGGNFIVS